MNPLKDFADFRQFIASFTNYEKFPAFQYDGEAFRLDRMRSLVEELGSPERDFASVHIAGTKGKGTTTLVLEALLRESGLRVGSYTSPHLEHLRERIRVDGEPIAEARLVSLVNRALPVLSARRQQPRAFPTFFELLTALAFLEFSTREVDVAVIEVGLGGRLDATNVITPAVCAVTSIGLEHTQLLGETLEEIAREKAGILKPGVPAVIGSLPDSAEQSVEAVAREVGAPLVFADPAAVTPLAHGSLGLADYEMDFDAPAIRGPALRADLSIAWQLWQLAMYRLDREPDEAILRRTLADLRLPARIEVFPGTPLICLDGAHTVESIDALISTLSEIEFPQPRTLIVSLAADKRIGPISEKLKQLADHIIVTRADAQRSLDPEELRETIGHGEVIDDPFDALRAARHRGDPIVITGSIYLAGALRGELLAGLTSAP